MGFYTQNGGFIGTSYTTDSRGVFDIISHQLDIPESYYPTYITDNLVLDLDAGSTSSYDPTVSTTTWNSVHQTGTSSATLSGSPTHVSSSPGHFDFDGTNDYAYGPSFTADNRAYSLELWFRTSSAEGELLISCHNDFSGTPSNYDRQIWVGTDGELWFGQWEGTRREINDVTTINDGYWHHVVAVWDGTDMYLYRDNQSAGSNTSASGSTDNGTRYWNIGGRRNSSWSNASSSYPHYINADIAIVRVYWGKGLSSSEVSTNYNAFKSRFGY